MAVRIQARAICRAGRLLREIEPANRSGMNQHEPRDGAVPRQTRKSAAEVAGMSEYQRKTAIRVGGIPEDQSPTHPKTGEK